MTRAEVRVGRMGHKSCWAVTVVTGGVGVSSPSVKTNREEMREKCGKIAVKLRCFHQTSRSLKKQHFCTGDTQGTNRHAMGTSRKQLRKNCEKLRTSPPPPLRDCRLLETV